MTEPPSENYTDVPVRDQRTLFFTESQIYFQAVRTSTLPGVGETFCRATSWRLQVALPGRTPVDHERLAKNTPDILRNHLNFSSCVFRVECYRL